MANLLPYIKPRFFDDDGEPLAGGKLWSYQAGTTTQLATYTDASETTTNANPIILDANGEADIWIGASNYKFVLMDSNDVVLDTIDNVQHISALSITTAKLADGSVTTSKLADGVLSANATGRGKMANNFLSNDATGRSKMQDGFLSADAAGRLKMADGFVTRAKLEAVGQQISAAANFSHSTSTPTDVTNLTVTLTTTGRPIKFLLIPDGATGGYIRISKAIGEFTGSSEIYLLEGASAIATYFLAASSGTADSGTNTVPPGVISFIHPVSAGTRTYKFQVATLFDATIQFSGVKLVAYEL